MSDSRQSIIRLGVVSFLNTRPLIDDLVDDPRFTLQPAVPARLGDMLEHREVDAALVPVVQWARAEGAWARVSNAGIASEGETMTVRVFSRVPPDRMSVLHVDGDSRTSVALARLLWTHFYRRPLEFRPFSREMAEACESVLLIGDKVVTEPVSGFKYQVDLGSAWQSWTGLPFVFAVWAAPSGGDHEFLASRLNASRDRGVERAEIIATQAGPEHGWPVKQACDYLTTRMKYVITPQFEAGMSKFIELAAAEGIIPPTGVLAP